MLASISTALIVIFALLSSATAMVSNDTTTESPEVDEEFYLDKDESFKSCVKFVLEPDEYTLFPNGTVYVEGYNVYYTESHYYLHEGTIAVCEPPAVNDNKIQQYNDSTLATFEMTTLSNVGLVISMVCLLVHLIVFVLVPGLKNMPGWNLASMCLSLLLAHGSLLSRSMVFEDEITVTNRPVCIVFAVLMQFFLLSSFLWMFLISLDVFKTIQNATGNLQVSSQRFRLKKYACNSLIAWGVSSVFTVAALVVDNVDDVEESFKPNFSDSCWFMNKVSLLMFFAGPVMTLICINFILFGISAYSIFANRLRQGQDSNCSMKKSSFIMYFRLFIIMGATWITGTLAPLANLSWLWYVCVAMNAFQGLFIFVAFTCSAKVRKFVKKKLVKSQRRASEQTIAPTFQSYCYYASSIEKDLDKIVEKDKPEIDTIVIHI